MTRECTEIQAQLPLYVGGDLEAPRERGSDLGSDHRESDQGSELAERIRRHLEACAVCADELARLQSALSVIGVLREERLPAIDVWPQVRTELSATGLFAGSASIATPATATSATSEPVASVAASRSVPVRRIANWRRVAASIALVGFAAALWSIVRSNAVQPASQVQPPSGTNAPLAAGEVALNEPIAGSEFKNEPEVTLVSDAALVSAPTPQGEGPGESIGGLHKVGAEEMALWRGARRFGTSTGAARASTPWPNTNWQAASYPVYDPRVR